MVNIANIQVVSAGAVLRRYTKPTPSPTKPGDVLFSGKVIGEVSQHFAANANIYVPPDWAWSWLAEQEYDGEEYRGSLSLRLAKYYRIHVGKKPPRGFQEEIGNLVGDERATSPYLLSFTSDLWWQAGEFGDGKSCFMNSDNPERHIMTDNGCWGTNVWAWEDGEDGEDGKVGVGKGRTWLAPDTPFFGAFTTFNAYGLKHPTIANLISQVTGLPNKCVSIDNDGYDIFLNGDAFVYWQGDRMPGSTVYLNLTDPYEESEEEPDERSDG